MRRRIEDHAQFAQDQYADHREHSARGTESPFFDTN